MRQSGLGIRQQIYPPGDQETAQHDDGMTEDQKGYTPPAQTEIYQRAGDYEGDKPSEVEAHHQQEYGKGSQQ